MTNDYLIREKPFKALLIFALPIFLGNLFQQFYTMFDQIIVGQFVGETAQAAVGASYSLANVFICIALGGGIGASVVVSKYFGAKDYTNMKTSVCTAMLSFLALSILLGLFGYVLCRELMTLLNTPEEALDLAVGYLKIYFLGLPFLFMYNVLSTMFNALGMSRIPLCFLIFSSLLNINLDYYFVAGFGMGVNGAAWATLIAQGVSVFLSLIVFLRTLRQFKGERPALFSFKLLNKMTRIALPSVLQQSTVSIGMLLVQSVVNGFGTSVLAGFSAATRIESICIVPFAAIGNALSSYTAQNLGANRRERVVSGLKAAAIVIALCAAVVCLVLELFHRPLIGLFSENASADAMATGTDYLKFMGWFFLLLGIKMAIDGVLRGSGDMAMFTIANLANLSLRVVLAVTLAPRFGIEFVWIAVPIGWGLNALLSFLQYRRGKWKKMEP